MKYLILIFILSFSSLSSKEIIININKSRIEQTNTNIFKTHKEALAMNITHSEIVSARMQIESALNLKLDYFKGWKPILGESHITVITPPEFNRIQKYISMSQINNIARREKIQRSDIKMLGIGSAKKEDAQTFFIIVKSKNLLKIREAIASVVYLKSKDNTLFAANWFYPHITIGYIKKDLHEKDGVIKNTLKSYDKRFTLK